MRRPLFALDVERVGVSGLQRQTYPSPQPRGRISFVISADGESSGVDDLNFPRGDATGPSRLLTTRFQLSRSSYRVSLTYVPDGPWAKQRAFTSLFKSPSQVGASKPNRRDACATERLSPGKSRYSRRSRRSTYSKVNNSTLHSTQHHDARLTPMRLVQSALSQCRTSRQMSAKTIETCSPAFECPAVLNTPLRQATRHKSAARNWGTVDTTAFRFESSRFHSELPARCFVARSTLQCSFRAELLAR